MSGHSKWHNIRIRKARVDAQRGKIFTKVAREIIMAAREGGGDPDVNARLRDAVQRARDVSMPQDNITRAIQRGTGELPGVQYEEIVYEGYGPGGVAILVQALTDNRNRTVSELRSMFSRHGGNLGEAGSVAWMFSSKGVIIVPRQQIEEDSLLEIVLDAGAEDMKTDANSYEITTGPEDFEAVKTALTEQSIGMESADLTLVPHSTVTLTSKDGEQTLRLMDALEDHDDAQRVYANFDIPESVMEQAAAA
ncbi:MAG: YebC/PmpR family DNA-binding transcriptional regulator [Armatimonadota bacterium]|nr:MAG: YebC/PmpR family DNA-binding transcriptional regulator [Armatimonadota bacterium]